MFFISIYFKNNITPITLYKTIMDKSKWKKIFRREKHALTCVLSERI